MRLGPRRPRRGRRDAALGARAWCSPAGSSRRPRLRCGSGRASRRRATSGRRSPRRRVGDPDMGYAADVLAEKAGVSRARQDAYAARSHAAAAATRDAGGFDAEVVPVAGVHRDERPRAGLTAERLARLRPAFRPAREGGTVTAGNACGVNDGAAAVALVDADDPPAARRARACACSPRPPPASTRTCPASAWCPPRAQALATAGLGGRRPRRGRAQRGVRRPGAGVLRRPGRSTRSGSASRAERWPSATRGGRRGRCSSCGCSPSSSATTGSRYGLAAIAVGGGQGVAMVVERCR